MSVYLPQAEFQEFLGAVIAEHSLIEGEIGMIEIQIAQLNERVSVLERERKASHSLISSMKAILLKDPGHTPLPSKAPGPLTRPKNSRPPPRSGPPPLPPRKRPR